MNLMETGPLHNLNFKNTVYFSGKDLLAPSYFRYTSRGILFVAISGKVLFVQ